MIISAVVNISGSIFISDSKATDNMAFVLEVNPDRVLLGLDIINILLTVRSQ